MDTGRLAAFGYRLPAGSRKPNAECRQLCSASGSFPVSMSIAGAWSRGPISSTCAMPATPWKWRGATKKRVRTGLEAVSWAKRVQELGAGEIVLTSMDADGTKAGYDVAMTSAVSRAVSIPVVASGGAGCPQHLFEVLTQGGADAALAASI